ncbi:MAG TPA: hypothetical protein VEI04_11865 [Syntrophobacteria bacterium]|nr:hypothetical protein [Syntrophobacteria bacterium]
MTDKRPEVSVKRENRALLAVLRRHHYNVATPGGYFASQVEHKSYSAGKAMGGGGEP